MASQVDNVSQADTKAADDPRQALMIATSAQVGLFGEGPPEFPESCVRSCLTSPEDGGTDGGTDGACAIVRRLAEGRVPKDHKGVLTCDCGHTIRIHPTAGLDANLLILFPSADLVVPPDSLTPADRTMGVAKLWEHYERLSMESQGLALELINSYEQLNVIFNITKQAGTVKDVKQITLLLLGVLAETLSCDWAYCITEKDGLLWWSIDDQIDRNATAEWIGGSLAHELETVAEQKQIIVRAGLRSPDNERSGSVIVGPLSSMDELDDIVILGRSGDREFKSGDMQMLDSVLNFGGQVISNLRLMERLKTLSLEAVLALVSAIDKKDTYTSGHSERVGVLSQLIGEKMGLPETDLQDLEWAGILHDVGKIGISDGILTKPGSLTDEEFDLIMLHPRMSFEVLEPLQSFGKVREAVLHHHETPDGQGYPDGLQESDIPMLARIVHVADTFDALTSDRSYRRGFSMTKAMEIMHEDSGTKIDTEALGALEEALEALGKREPHRYQRIFGHIREDRE